MALTEYKKAMQSGPEEFMYASNAIDGFRSVPTLDISPGTIAVITKISNLIPQVCLISKQDDFSSR